MQAARPDLTPAVKRTLVLPGQAFGFGCHRAKGPTSRPLRRCKIALDELKRNRNFVNEYGYKGHVIFQGMLTASANPVLFLRL